MEQPNPNIDPLAHVSPCFRNTSPEVAQFNHERIVGDLNSRLDAVASLSARFLGELRGPRKEAE